MNFQMKLLTVAVGCGFLGGAALAGTSAADIERLGKDLTPTGAIRAGNARERALAQRLFEERL